MCICLVFNIAFFNLSLSTAHNAHIHNHYIWSSFSGFYSIQQALGWGNFVLLTKTMYFFFFFFNGWPSCLLSSLFNICCHTLLCRTFHMTQLDNWIAFDHLLKTILMCANGLALLSLSFRYEVKPVFHVHLYILSPVSYILWCLYLRHFNEP